MSGGRLGEWHEWPFEPLEVLRALDKHDVEYVLVGGLAAVLQGSPLPTYDIDIAPSPDPENRSRLSAVLADIGATAASDASDSSAAESLSTPFGYLDLHHQPAGFKSYAALRRNAHPIELEPGLTVCVLPLRDIIRSRLAAGDYRQLPALEATLELARQSERS